MSNSWGLIIATHDVRPAGALGVTVTPDNNAYGSYAQVYSGASWPSGSGDAYEIEININSNGVSGAARDTIVTIGLDLAGGTTYTDFISHLLCSCASDLIGGQSGVTYRFPVRVPAGASIGAKASVNNATVGTLNVHAKLYCKPSHPELIRFGSFVRTFGAVAASSCGTSVTSGTTSEGSFTDLGTLADEIFAWEVGFGVHDNVIGAAVSYHADLGVGDASNQQVVLADCSISLSSAEELSKAAALSWARGASGDHVYGRLQCSGGGDANLSMIAYGVGG